MEFHFTSKLEEYYQKFVELQDKLKKSEEQRFLLEMKFNEMVQVAKEEEQVHYKKLRAQYKRFLEEDKKRQDRNERIIRNLERIETRISMLSAKTERINMFRRQYQSFLLRIASKPKQGSVISRERSFVRQEQKSSLFTDDASLSPKPTETLDLKKPLFQHPTVKKTVDKDQSNDEKIEILDRYLQSMSSQRCRDLLNHERESREKLTLGTRPDVLWKDDAPSTNHATAIADDIMNSIYSRYYNKTDGLPNNSKLNLEGATAGNETKNINAEVKPDPPQAELVEDGNLTDTAAANEAKQAKIIENDNDNNIAEEVQRTDENQAISAEAAKNKEPMQNSHKADHISEASNEINFSVDNVIDNNLDSKSHNDLPLAQQPQEQIPVRVEDYAEQEQYNPSKANPSEPIHTQNIVSDQADYVDQYENLQYDQNEQPIINNEQFPQYDENPLHLSYQDHQVDEHDANQLQVQDNQYYENELASQYYPEGSVRNDLPVQQYQENVAVTEQTALPNETDQEHYDQPVLYDQQQPIQYDQQPIQYDQQQPIQYDQQGKDIGYDPNAPLTGYDQYGQPLLYDQHGQIAQLQYDENGQIIPQYDENGQMISLYDQNGQQYYGEQQQYDEQGQPVAQYDEQGQPVAQYEEQGQPVAQYDEQGQPVAQYDEQSQPVAQYDEQGQPVPQYDEQGQPVVQYDANGQPIYSQDYNYTNQNEESDLGYYVEPERGQQLSEKEANDYQEHVTEEELHVEPTKQNDNDEIKVMDMLDTDTESSKQNTSKVSNDADFDFS